MLNLEKLQVLEESSNSPFDPATFKGVNPYMEFTCQVFKKCCKKYKKGKRCSKCPDR